jgi:hypothetical protein
MHELIYCHFSKMLKHFREIYTLISLKLPWNFNDIKVYIFQIKGIKNFLKIDHPRFLKSGDFLKIKKLKILKK